MTKRTDTEDDELELLVIRCQLGEREAFETLIQQHAQSLHNHLRRVSGDPQAAQDLAQDVWLKVLQGLGGLKDTRRFRGWLFSIAHRKLMDRFRAHYRQALDHRTDVDSLPEDQDLGARLRLQNELLDALEWLPIIERETLHLFYIEGLSLQEVADSLSVPVGTVKSRLFRGRQQLRAQLDHGNH